MRWKKLEKGAKIVTRWAGWAGRKEASRVAGTRAVGLFMGSLQVSGRPQCRSFAHQASVIDLLSKFFPISPNPPAQKGMTCCRKKCPWSVGLEWAYQPPHQPQSHHASPTTSAANLPLPVNLVQRSPRGRYLCNRTWLVEEDFNHV